MRLRLTALYGALFLASATLVLAITYALVYRATDRAQVTLPGGATVSVEEDSSAGSGVPPASGVVSADEVRSLAGRQHAERMHELLVRSGVALAATAVVSLGVGWMVAGQVLRPVERAFRAQRQFVANASHELRTPLARQRTIGQVALDDPDADITSLRRAHERVLVAGAEQERLIDALLALARGQNGQATSERVDLADAAGAALAARRDDAAGRGVEVRSDLAPAPAVGDPRLIERLVGNLVDNALRHNHDGGHVSVTTVTRGRHAVLTVANTGQVVPAGDVERLFDPFERLGTRRAYHDRGLGLGLAIVRAVAEAHRAGVRAEPRPGGGLHVEVRFAAQPS
jgi:signal transduction histidine kinase